MKHLRKTLSLLLLSVVIAGLLLTAQLMPGKVQQVASADSSTLNPVQQENLLPGTPDWQITKQPPADTTNYSHDKGIEGYTSQTSVMVGSTINFAVSTVTSTFTADIYRLGWYQGIGARLVQTIANIPGKSYSVPKPQASTGLIEAKWSWAFSLQVPSNWVSGMFVAKLTDTNGEQIYVPFIVKSPTKTALVMVHTANTDEAYNIWGGTSLYQDLTNKVAAGRAYKVSFDRPFYYNQGMGNMFNWEYPMVRWMEENGYDVSYLSDEDLTNSKSNALLGYKGILIVGHSEYWSSSMRANLQVAINSGVSLASFAANNIYWQIRYQASSYSGANRIIVCYKSASLDPMSQTKPQLTTVNFRSAPVLLPEQSLLGSMYNSYLQGSGDPWVVSDATSWIFGGTNMQNGDSIPGLVGYEFDSDSAQYPSPLTATGADGVKGVEILSTSPVTDVYNNQTVSNSTLYTSPNGARVINMGTIQWAWGLDSFGTAYNAQATVVSQSAQQITANILYNFVTGSTGPAPQPLG